MANIKYGTTHHTRVPRRPPLPSPRSLERMISGRVSPARGSGLSSASRSLVSATHTTPRQNATALGFPLSATPSTGRRESCWGNETDEADGTDEAEQADGTGRGSPAADAWTAHSRSWASSPADSRGMAPPAPASGNRWARGAAKRTCGEEAV
eukprot:scaffold2297_cov102-Isochrysis_galbana.AAC.3